MSVVVINAIEVPAERADMMAERFANRQGEVEKMDGFEEFQLLRPSDDRTRWLVYTRWRDRAAFEAWMGSAAFTQGHARSSGPASSGDTTSVSQGPVGTGSEVWVFDVEQQRGQA